MQTTKSFIEALPKAELHLHIEGSLEPEMMMQLAQRNKVRLPYSSVEDIQAAYKFNNLQEFLDIYYQGMSVLQTEQDFFDLTMAYLEKAKADNVRHAEIFFDPQGHTERGLDFSVAIEGILSALQQGEKVLGISSHLIMCFLRHLSEEDAFKTLEQAAPWTDRLLGVGLDSSELGHPPSKFKNVFAQARARGLKAFAHGGEEGPPDYVRECLELLKIDRLDHGNRALEDEALVRKLVAEQIVLTVCPLSNLKLCVVDELPQHPLKRMLQEGLKVTINSDDPSYFGGYINENYQQTADALNLSQDDLRTCAINSIEGSYLPEDEKKTLVKEITAL